MPYRNKAFVSFDGDTDMHYYQLMRAWTQSDHTAFGFYNAVMGKGSSIPLDFLRLQLWNIMPNGRSTMFYSIGPWREKHADWFYEDLIELFNLLSQNRIKPAIGERMPLVEAVHAHELIEQAAVQGKIVLMVS